jgi:hypothetical protein
MMFVCWVCALGLGRKFSLSFFRESFCEIHFLFLRKILYEKTKLLRKFLRKQNFWFREKILGRSRGSVKMMWFCNIFNYGGDKSFRFCFFVKFSFRFCKKILAKVQNFHKNLIFAVLEPLRFGSNQMRLSAAPAMLKWPYGSCHHRYWLKHIKLISWPHGLVVFWRIFVKFKSFRENLSRKIDKISQKSIHFLPKFSFSRKVKKVFSSQP